jgi:hypothetical protein
MKDLLKNRILKSLIPSYINEGISDKGTPDMKYYAFDWDDNLLYMPTKIMLEDEDGDEVPMGTEDFAEYRTEIGKEPFKYKGRTIVGFADDPFRNFRTEGDKVFLIDSMVADTGPAWDDFIEAINGGSVFAIITARGHKPDTLKESVYNMIVSNHNGINKKLLIKNLRNYRSIDGMEDMSDDEIIREYLDMCQFSPVSYGSGSASNPEEGKIDAMNDFIDHVKKIAKKIHKRAFMKEKIANKFIPMIGFSDDDIRNVEKMKTHFEKNKPEGVDLTTYSTTGGIKKKY